MVVTSIFCYCRSCGKKYEEHKSRADYKGYCSSFCLHKKAKSKGYKKEKLGSSEYDVLKKANLIGSVCFEHHCLIENSKCSQCEKEK